MIKKFAPVIVVSALTSAALIAMHGAACAQAAATAAPLIGAQAPGARAGNSYVPSTHTPGCGGALCDATDPQRMAGPPPPCQGLICGVSPYSMQPPVTASEAARLQQDPARTTAAATAPQPAEKPHARHRTVKHVAVKKTAAKTAARTPDPAEAAPAAPAH